MENRVDRWLRLLGGPDWEGREARDAAVREMRELGTATVFPILLRKRSDADLDTSAVNGKLI
jgi:hypothetical protein